MGRIQKLWKSMSTGDWFAELGKGKWPRPRQSASNGKTNQGRAADADDMVLSGLRSIPGFRIRVSAVAPGQLVMACVGH
jgi:hypothetical protein